jgi:hypothetical protein
MLKEVLLLVLIPSFIVPTVAGINVNVIGGGAERDFDEGKYDNFEESNLNPENENYIGDEEVKKLGGTPISQDEEGNDDGDEEDGGGADWRNSCYDSGYRAGQDGPFSQPTYDHCGDEYNGDDSYYDGFIDGCMSVSGNTMDVCESATDA